MSRHLNIVVLGLSITSSWGNGHATTYRSLLRAMAGRGHNITFLERDVPWYARHRDMPQPPFCTMHLYRSLYALAQEHQQRIAEADVVIVGSFVPEGVAVGEFVIECASGLRVFYDIDTPVTLENLMRGKCDYLSPPLIRSYDLYLSFTGGPTLDHLEQRLGAQHARPLYCCVDTDYYTPATSTVSWDLGYLGTYSRDRQPPLEKFLITPALRWPEGNFVVAGPQYPPDIDWPPNVKRIEHLPPSDHPDFYHRQRFTLNVTRADMRVAGYSPSVRLFEAAACGTPIISDTWPGLDSIFAIDREILTAETSEQVLSILRDLPERQQRDIAAAARQRVLNEHSAQQRAAQLEGYLMEKIAEPHAHNGAVREFADG